MEGGLLFKGGGSENRQEESSQRSSLPHLYATDAIAACPVRHCWGGGAAWGGALTVPQFVETRGRKRGDMMPAAARSAHSCPFLPPLVILQRNV